MSQTDNKIKYGKYDLVKPWSSSPLRVHYENTKPFKKVRDVCPVCVIPMHNATYAQGSHSEPQSGTKLFAIAHHPERVAKPRVRERHPRVIRQQARAPVYRTCFRRLLWIPHTLHFPCHAVTVRLL